MSALRKVFDIKEFKRGSGGQDELTPLSVFAIALAMQGSIHIPAFVSQLQIICEELDGISPADKQEILFLANMMEKAGRAMAQELGVDYTPTPVS